MSATPVVELGSFQFRARCRRQAESLMSVYRKKKGEPGDTDCQPGVLLTRPSTPEAVASGKVAADG